jgi:hypothetical protein
MVGPGPEQRCSIEKVITVTDLSAWRDQLAHVRWIGGPPDAGKSTVALLLAERYGVPVYRQDGRELAHLRQATPACHPANAELWRTITEEGEDAFIQTWVDNAPATLADQARAVWSERIDFICEDLSEVEPSGGIIAEGPGFFPDVITPLLSSPHQAIWLIPTESFKRRSHIARGKSERRTRTSDPDLFLEHHIARDLIFAEQYRREVIDAGLPWIEIDGSDDAETIAHRVATHFGLE